MMRFGVIVLVVGSGCGSVGGGVDASPPVNVDAAIDAAIDAPPGTVYATSCNAIHMADVAQPSGTYTIDPDGEGGDPPLAVTCDMVVNGGGWTIVYFPTGTNSASKTLGYTSSTPRLLTDATQVLLAYRSATKVAYTNYASFDLPADWRTAAPFTYPATDVAVGVSINGAPLAVATVRYGYANFSHLCTDVWADPATSPYGRMCIENTVAPFFSGFAVATADQCSDSSQTYTASACTTDLRFSIAVR